MRELQAQGEDAAGGLVVPVPDRAAVRLGQAGHDVQAEPVPGDVLALGILTKDVYAGLELAERIPSGLVHINDQTVNDEAVAPFGGVGVSGTGSRHGGPSANIEAFTETQWVTLRGDLPVYPL